jgi:hypothetical protein
MGRAGIESNNPFDRLERRTPEEMLGGEEPSE